MGRSSSMTSDGLQKFKMQWQKSDVFISWPKSRSCLHFSLSQWQQVPWMKTRFRWKVGRRLFLLRRHIFVTWPDPDNLLAKSCAKQAWVRLNFLFYSTQSQNVLIWLNSWLTMTLNNWLKSTPDSKWISELWFKLTHDSKSFRNLDSNQLMTQLCYSPSVQLCWLRMTFFGGVRLELIRPDKSIWISS